VATIGIAGAGLFGRTLAHCLLRVGWKTVLFDRDQRSGERSCGYAGAGMLTPYAELETGEPIVAELGRRSLPLWREIIARLYSPVYFQEAGSVAVAHPRDAADLDAFAARVARKADRADALCELGESALAELEPELAGRFKRGLHFPHEGQLDPRELMDALAEDLEIEGAAWFERTGVEATAPGRIHTGAKEWRFDWVVDARGLGAKPDLLKLRGVRGELLWLYAPEVALRRPVRLMHPRYPLYAAPRRDDVYLVGATSIESEDMGPVTVKSSLELLSAAYSLHPGFAEAAVLESVAHCRPALPDNVPRIFHRDGLIRVNGLYRHGYLTAPALAQEVIALLNGGEPRYPELIEAMEDG